jgi:hypothetical protein
VPSKAKARVDWWHRRVTKFGAAIAAVMAIGAAGNTVFNAVDSRYALAGDTRALHTDVLRWQRDTLVRDRSQIEQAQRSRRLSSFELDQLRGIQERISDLDRRLEQIQKPTRR